MNLYRLSLIYLLLALGLISCDTQSYSKKEVTTKTEEKVSKKSFKSTTFTIDEKLDEISGLQIVEEYFYGFNDSGGKSELYKIDKQGKIVQTIALANAKNKDWESMAMNEDFIFIADVGNNYGNRKDLCIYYIDRKQIDPNKETQQLQAKKITFHYPEQADFSSNAYKHDFDCEAICWFNDKIHLFTKEWKSKKTHHYTLTLSEKHQAAKLIDSYDTGFLVTGADILKINEKKALLALIGYTKLGSIYFVRSEITNTANDQLLAAPKEKTRLGNSMNLGQVEGISIHSPTVFYYSAEDFKKVPQHITRLELVED